MEVMERWFKFYFEVNQVEKIDEGKTSTYVLVRWKQDMIKKFRKSCMYDFQEYLCILFLRISYCIFQ